MRKMLPKKNKFQTKTLTLQKTTKMAYLNEAHKDLKELYRLPSGNFVKKNMQEST